MLVHQERGEVVADRKAAMWIGWAKHTQGNLVTHAYEGGPDLARGVRAVCGVSIFNGDSLNMLRDGAVPNCLACQKKLQRFGVLQPSDDAVEPLQRERLIDTQGE